MKDLIAVLCFPKQAVWMYSLYEIDLNNIFLRMDNGNCWELD